MLLPQKDFCEEKMNYPILENDYLKITVDPSHGGRIIGFLNKLRGAEQIWYDPSRLPVDPALDYDGNFAGGMDELLPNDPPEDGFPDHGELWTLPLNWRTRSGWDSAAQRACLPEKNALGREYPDLGISDPKHNGSSGGFLMETPCGIADRMRR